MEDKKYWVEVINQWGDIYIYSNLTLNQADLIIWLTETAEAEVNKNMRAALHEEKGG